MHFFFSPPGLAALLRSACFSLGAVFFARMAPAPSVFGGFQIGFKKVQTFVDLVDLLESFPTSIVKSASIRPRTSLSKFAKN